MPSEGTWIDLEIITLTEIRQKRQLPHDITYTRNLFMTQMNWTQRQTHRQQTCSFQGGRLGEEMDWEFRLSRFKLLHVRRMNNQGPAVLHRELYPTFCDNKPQWKGIWETYIMNYFAVQQKWTQLWSINFQKIHKAQSWGRQSSHWKWNPLRPHDSRLPPSVG